MKSSEVEQITERIEKRREERLPITRRARERFLRDCRQIAIADKQHSTACISESDLISYRERIMREAEVKGAAYLLRWVWRSLGILTDLDGLVSVLDRAQDVTRDAIDEGSVFYFIDFCHNSTKIASRWPWMRSAFRKSLVVLFFFYLSTPLLFCHVLNQTGICDPGPKGYGWASAAYFASATLSTVGYGDLTVGGDPDWLRYVGSFYMLISMVVAVVAFSAAADITASPFQNSIQRMVLRWERAFIRNDGTKDRYQLMKERLRRVLFTKLTCICTEITVFIFIGIIASQVASAMEERSSAKWSFATSFYWATQTCLTVGYGDISEEPDGLRLFKIFYLLLSTYIVGSSFGRLGSLKEELSEMKRFHAWDTRPVTPRYIDEFQAYDHDDKVDQYEFVVASLVMLGKIDSDDIGPIMEKFKSLAGAKDYISVREDIVDETLESDNHEYDHVKALSTVEDAESHSTGTEQKN